MPQDTNIDEIVRRYVTHNDTSIKQLSANKKEQLSTCIQADSLIILSYHRQKQKRTKVEASVSLGNISTRGPALSVTLARITVIEVCEKYKTKISCVRKYV